MTDIPIPSLIEGLTAIRNALRDDLPLAEIHWDRYLTEAAKAISRLTVSRPPSPGAAAAAVICHDEQLEIWADEFVEHLLAAGGANCLPDFETYGDKITYFSAIKGAIFDLVGKAFDHPELIVSPPPEEIAGLIESLKQRPCTPLAELREEAAAALQRLARDAKMVRECNASLGKRITELEADLKGREAVADSYAEENQRFHDRIAEIEAERHQALILLGQTARQRDGINKDCEDLRASIAELEAELARARETNQVLMGQLELECRERDAIRAKTIEECAECAERFLESRIGAAVARAIRALNQPEAGGGERGE